jgi:hypothetical protein
MPATNIINATHHDLAVITLIDATPPAAAAMAALWLGLQLDSLFTIALLAGFAFGGHWSSVPATASDVFGLRNFSSIYCSLQLAPAAGALLFASWLAGRNAAAAVAVPGSDCIGRACYELTWGTLLTLNIAAGGVAAWLWRSSSRTVYSRMGGHQSTGG